jgi:hypothetical protein
MPKMGAAMKRALMGEWMYSRISAAFRESCARLTRSQSSFALVDRAVSPFHTVHLTTNRPLQRWPPATDVPTLLCSGRLRDINCFGPASLAGGPLAPSKRISTSHPINLAGRLKADQTGTDVLGHLVRRPLPW